MNNKPYKAGRFAKSMRKYLFNEHLGLFDDSEHDIEDPLSSDLLVSIILIICIKSRKITSKAYIKYTDRLYIGRWKDERTESFFTMPVSHDAGTF